MSAAPLTTPPPAEPIDVDALAEAFLTGIPAYVWDGESLPVPVEEIADSHAGLLVRDVVDLQSAPGAPPALDGQGLSGLLLPQAGEIRVNADEARQWPARRRFTIAHELGHWQLHRGDQPAVFCRSTAIDPAATGDAPASRGSGAQTGGVAGTGRRTDRPPPPPAEEQANAFAAAVLMAARLIRERYARQPRDFPGLCAAFGASGAAMGRRLHAVIPRAGRAETGVRRRPGRGASNANMGCETCPAPPGCGVRGTPGGGVGSASGNTIGRR